MSLLLGLFLLLGGLNLLFMALDKHVSKIFKYVSKNRVDVLRKFVSFMNLRSYSGFGAGECPQDHRVATWRLSLP